MTSAQSSVAQWGPIDIATVIVYFVVIGGIAIYICINIETKSEDKQSKSDDYFLARHSVPWWAVSASLFSANIGAEHFIALAGSAAYSGIVVAWYEWGSVLSLLALGYFFLPIYFKSDVKTMPEWVEKRFNVHCRKFVIVFSLFIYTVTKISATLYAGKLIITQVSSLNGDVAIILMVFGTSIYTMLGGLAVVIYTEVLQSAVLITGGITLLIIGWLEVGGIQGIVSSFPNGNTGLYLSIIRPVTDSSFPWPGIFIGFYASSIWYWCTDQVIVQRTLAAKNIEHGQAGAVGAAFLKFLPGFIIVIPGMIGRSLWIKYGITQVGSDSAVYETIYPWMVMNVLPLNVRGLVVSAMLSALMGHLAAVFNTCSTLFAENVYLPERPNATQDELVWVGRFSVIGIALISISWLPVIPYFSSQLFLYIQQPPAFMAPPILAMFVCGLCFKFVTSESVLLTISFGVGIGFLRFLCSIIYGYGNRNPFISFVVSVSFLYFSLGSFLISSFSILTISYLRPQTKDWQEDDTKLVWCKGLYFELIQKYDEQSTPRGDEEQQVKDISNISNKRIFRKWIINTMSVFSVCTLVYLTVIFD